MMYVFLSAVHDNRCPLYCLTFPLVYLRIKYKAVEDSRLRPRCAMHCSHPQPNSVVCGEDYGRGMSVSRRQRGDGEMKRCSLDMWFWDAGEQTDIQTRFVLHHSLPGVK